MSPAELHALARRYPEPVIAVEQLLLDIDRVAFNLQLALQAVADPSRSVLCDLGGGFSLFAPACVRAGFKRVVLVDDFADPGKSFTRDQGLAVPRAVGVEIVQRDVMVDGWPPALTSVDVVTVFEAIEHWHHSPKSLLHHALAALTPGGALILSVPNCVDLPKRILGLMGRARWSRMEDWYEVPVFRGHVREASRADLGYIARDLGLTDVRILGTNWHIRRLFGQLPDQILRRCPSLCSTLYLIGRKPWTKTGHRIDPLSQAAPA